MQRNELLIKAIKDAFADEKQTAEYKLQLNKVCEMEESFTKDFSKDKWKEYLLLDIEKGQLDLIATDQLIEFVIKFVNNIRSYL